jgi:hypothetical protein
MASWGKAIAKLAFDVIPQNPTRSNTDADRVFKKMLEGGYPPNNWDQLLKSSAYSKE